MLMQKEKQKIYILCCI